MAQLRRALVGHSAQVLQVSAVASATAATEDTAGLSTSQLAVLHTVILCCCSLSLAGCLFMLRHHYQSARRHGGTSMVQKMVVTLSVFDACFALPKMFGSPLNDGEDSQPDAACNIQAFSLHLIGLMSVAWNACIAHCLYRKIVHRDSEARLKARFKLYLLLAAVPAAACSVTLLSGGWFGDAVFYCWLPTRALQFGTFYSFVALAIVYVSVILWVTHRHIAHADLGDANLDAHESSQLIALKLRIYILAFIVLWLPSTVFRLLVDILGPARFPVALLMQATVCSQGFMTAVIYGGLLSRLVRACACRSVSATNKHKASPSFPTANTGLSPTNVPGQEYREPASIFVSTFNMGEARVTPAHLEKWIPRGHDIYVIGLQECLYLANTRSMLRQHLEGGRPRPATGHAKRASTFHQFNREIGSKNTSLGYHGHIAITVFIRSKDVESGAFYMPPSVQQEVNCGKSLVLGRASNKGAVGFAFRYYDTSFAFVACHFSSDPKGKSKVQRRNRDAQDMLKALHLNLEDVGFEFPHMHHHSFVLGDLNYRLTQREASPETILELVSSARRCETSRPKGSKNSGHLSGLRRGLLGKRWSPLSSRGLGGSKGSSNSRGVSDRRGLGSYQGDASDRDSNDLEVSILERSLRSVSSLFASSHGSSSSAQYSADCELGEEDEYVSWDDVLAHDELRSGMRDGQIFYGFREAKIAFPPTFRRVRGAALKRRTKLWPVAELSECFTTAVAGHGTRVPSYTDRILSFSQPDMRHRLRCALYASCEEVSCSDHKPVLSVFQALVNRDYLPIETELSNRRLQRMQDVCGVREFTLRLEFVSVSWLPGQGNSVGSTSISELPSTSIESAGDSMDQRFSTYDRHGHQILVTVVFPLPAEDIFSAQRKLLELADSMSGGVYLENPERLQCKSNVATVKWSDFMRDGLTHTTFARPTGTMHVAIKVHVGNGGPCLGQGVICLPQASGVSVGTMDDPESLTQLQNFTVELAEGGRHTGSLSGALGLQLAQHASIA